LNLVFCALTGAATLTRSAVAAVCDRPALSLRICGIILLHRCRKNGRRSQNAATEAVVPARPSGGAEDLRPRWPRAKSVQRRAGVHARRNTPRLTPQHHRSHWSATSTPQKDLKPVLVTDGHCGQDGRAPIPPKARDRPGRMSCCGQERRAPQHNNSCLATPTGRLGEASLSILSWGQVPAPLVKWNMGWGRQELSPRHARFSPA
jgi:hypothetical protein